MYGCGIIQTNLTKSKMDEQKQQITERIHQAQNILVAVSANPSVDQLAAAIGLTLLLNKLDKHGTAVFSGKIPDTIEFLKPEETLEKDTNSLRDFIIALDKAKADKLRYKVEDDVVRIFITPYRTSLSKNDLNFSQGDFNVDVVIALGVTNQADLDTSITAHGRILHDATVVGLGNKEQGDLGTINWIDPQASSLSEMIVTLGDGLGKNIFDQQIATALLTGIVAATDRFSNSLTSPRTMSASASLMAAGANQQLIATELQPHVPEPVLAPAPAIAPISAQTGQMPGQPSVGSAEVPTSEPGTLAIDHSDASVSEPPKRNNDQVEHESAFNPAVEQPDEVEEDHSRDNQVRVDENGELMPFGLNQNNELPKISQVHSGGNETDFVHDDNEARREPEAFRFDGLDTAPGDGSGRQDSFTEELNLPPLGGTPLLSHNETVLPENEPTKTPSQFIPQTTSVPVTVTPQVTEPTPPVPPTYNPPVQQSQPAFMAPTPPPTFSLPPPPPPPAFSLPPAPQPAFTPPSFSDDRTLTEIEHEVDSPHSANSQSSDVSDARSAVEAALASGEPSIPQPYAAMGSQPLGPELHQTQHLQTPPPPLPNMSFSEPTPGNSPADEAMDMPLPSNPFGNGQQSPVSASPYTPPVFTLPPSPVMNIPTNSFPGVPTQPQQNNYSTPPPPVPPPMLPPLQ